MDGRLSQAIARINAGDRQAASRMLAALIQDDPLNEAAWMWLSLAVIDPRRRQYCLRKVLAINPNNAQARAELEKQGGLKAAAIPPDQDNQPGPSLEPNPIPVIEIPGEPVVEIIPPPQVSAVEIIAIPDAPEPADEPREDLQEDQAEDLDDFAETPRPQVDIYPAPDEPSAEDVSAGAVETGAVASFEVPTRSLRGPDLPASPAEYTRSGYVITIGWVAPFRGADRVVLLEPEALIVANPDFEYIPIIRQQLVVGPVPHQLLGLSPRVYPLTQIERVTATSRGRRMSLFYRKGRRVRSAVVRFSNRDDCLDAFNTLQRRLGAGYSRTDNRLSRIFLALSLAALVALIGLFIIMTLQSSLGRPTTGVVAGGLLLLAMLLWLGSNLINPPLRMTVERKAKRLSRAIE